jgi:hypothetical protein
MDSSRKLFMDVVMVVGSLTRELSPWARILLEKLSSPQLVNKFSEFYVTRQFVT